MENYNTNENTIGFDEERKSLKMFEAEISDVNINKGPKIVCFIGSMKFWDDMLSEALKFHQSGNLVMLPIKDPRVSIPDEDIEMYDKLIRASINISDQVHVINKNRYIGDSVKSEIEYAKSKNKKITYMEEPIKIVTLCGSFKFTDTFNKINLEFTKNGILTFLPSLLNIENTDELSFSQINYLHEIHNMKIDMSDYVVFIDYDDSSLRVGCKHYIGKDTEREFGYASSRNKHILMLSDFSSIDELITRIKKGEDDE